MTKEEALAHLYVAVERRTDNFSHETIRRENSALQDAFEVLGVSSAGFWHVMRSVREKENKTF